MTSELTVQKAVDPALEDELARRFLAANENAKQLARDHAKKNLPPEQGGKIEMFTGQIRAEFADIMSTAGKILQGSTILHHGKQVFQEAERRIQVLKSQVRDLIGERTSRSISLKSTPKPESILWRMILAIILLIFFLLAEIWFNTRSMQNLGESLLAGLFGAIAVALAIHVAAWALPLLIRKVKDLKWKVVTAIGGVTFLSLVFLALGSMRMSDSGIPLWSFFLINQAIFVAAVGVMEKLIPSAEARKAVKKYRQLTADFQEIDRKIKDLEEEIETIEQTKNEKLYLLTMHLAYSEDVISRIQTAFEFAVNLYITENLLMRNGKDGVTGPVPECFDQPVQPIEGFDLNVLSKYYSTNS